MKATATNVLIGIFVFFIFLNIGECIEFGIEFKKEVEIGEEFSVKIISSEEEIYDVKVYVHNSEDEKITRGELISEIMKEEWAEPWAYIKESFPDKKDYLVRVFEGVGKRELCVNLRKPGKINYERICDQINILERKNEVLEEEDEEENYEEINEEENYEEINEEEINILKEKDEGLEKEENESEFSEVESEENEIKLDEIKNQEEYEYRNEKREYNKDEKEREDDEKIELDKQKTAITTKTIIEEKSKSESIYLRRNKTNEEIITNKERIRAGVFYAFSIVLIILTCLFLLRKI